jgi:hypothetical protein
MPDVPDLTATVVNLDEPESQLRASPRARQVFQVLGLNVLLEDPRTPEGRKRMGLQRTTGCQFDPEPVVVGSFQPVFRLAPDRVTSHPVCLKDSLWSC